MEEGSRESPELVLGIDASRNRSGGAKAHLIGILTEGDPEKHGIREVHVWSYPSLLEVVPNRAWLVKHSPKELGQSLFHQVWWQRFRFPREAQHAGCAIVLNTDAGTVARLRPAVTMSRDMLPYEPGEMERFGFSISRLRLILRHYVHNRSFRKSDGVIFLTHHAARVIQQSCGKLSRTTIIPHGVGQDFKRMQADQPWPLDHERPIQCLYVSNVAMYKHQWVVVRATATLRQRGRNVHLTLAGGGPGSGADQAQRLLEQELRVCDPGQGFVAQTGLVPYGDLPELLARADVFIFASSCENMPNTLVEAMAVGLPIACSNRGPMPEVLADGGVYFDPEDANSIADAIERIIKDPVLRATIAKRAKSLSEQYSWSRCADETWTFIRETYESVRV